MDPGSEFEGVGEGRLTPVTEIDIRGLAEVRDEKDVYLSVYLPTASREEEAENRSFVARRSRAMEEALPADLKASFRETMATVEDLLFSSPIPGERGRIVFASAPASFLAVYRVGIEPARAMVLDAPPFLLPLARMRVD